VLKNGLGSEIRTIKREYYRICVGLMDALKRERGVEFDARIAVMSLFGMMNWIYTWYNPRVDGDAQELAQKMSDIFLLGVTSTPAIRSGGHGNNGFHNAKCPLEPGRKSKDRDYKRATRN
jgi:hypothetical protein